MRLTKVGLLVVICASLFALAFLCWLILPLGIELRLLAAATIVITMTFLLAVFGIEPRLRLKQTEQN